MLLSKFRITLFIQFVFAISAFSQLNVNTYILEARKDISDKNYFEAIQKLDVCIEVYPGKHEAYFYRGICKYYLKDNLGAEQDLNNAISIYNTLLYDSYHYRSLVKYRLGDYEGAISDINHVIAVQGNDPQLYMERAFYKLSNQNFTDVISDCNAALRMNYFSENIYMCKGMAENALNKFDSASINYNMALKLNSGDEDLYIRIGMNDASMEKYNEAIEQYNHALKIDSASTLAYYNRAEANLKLNNDKSALEDYNMVITYDPMNALAYFNRGVMESNKNDYTNAIADFDKVLLLNPKNVQAWLNRAKLKYQTKDYNGSLTDYNKAIDLYPYLVEAYYDRAQLKEALHDNAGAKADYKMGNAIGELSRSGDGHQRANDSTNLMHLMALNSDFNNEDQKLSDTTHIDLMPLFYVTLKNNHSKSECIPLLFKKSHQEYRNFCLTNRKIQLVDSLKDSSSNILNENIKGNSGEILLQKAVQKTNMQLFNAAIKDYDKIIEQDTGYAIAYFARGIDICKEIEMTGESDNNEQDTYINKTYRVVNDPANDKYKKAFADFSKIIQIEPDFAFAYYDRAYVKYKLHDLNGAIDDYNNAILLNPDFAEAYYNRGLLLFCLNNKIDACVDFSKAGELGLTEAYLIIKLYCTEVTK